MGHGVESNFEHKRDNLSCMETTGNENKKPSCKIVVNMRKIQSESQAQTQSQSQSPEKSVMGETDSELGKGNYHSLLLSKSSVGGGFEAGNSVAVSKTNRHGSSSSSQSHICRFCSKVFSSGRALGGHVRVHGANGPNRSNGANRSDGPNGLSSSSGNISRVDQVGDYSSTNVWVKKPKAPTSRSNGNYNWVRAGSIEEEEEEEEEQEEAEKEKEEQEDYKAVKNMKMEELSNQKMVSLYTLRRNPKRSRRLTDEEFSMDLTATNNRACVECGKEFPSSKALFGHMRCHPEREWRGIQPPNANTISTDDGDYQNNTGVGGGGAIVVAAPSSGLSPVYWQSSQGSEDLREKGEEEAESASDNESDRESMKEGKEVHRQPASCRLPTWSVTAKRGRRRSIRSTQPRQKDGEEEKVEVGNPKELEDARDTAQFLVMLATSASNTNTHNNNNNKVNGLVERQMTEESVYHSKTRKPESQGSIEDLEAGEKDLDCKEKMKRRRTGKTTRPAELGAGLGKYKCSTCKKVFNSHQALGGHRASHRKVRGCFAINNVNDEGQEVTEEEITEEGSTLLRIEYHPAAADETDYSSPAREEKAYLSHLTEEQSPEPAIPIKKVKGHECSICHKVFPSGQALGGHKRCHWTGDRITETAHSVISTEIQPKPLRGQARHVREPLFDLNEPAPVEEEDLETAYGMTEVVPVCAESVNQRVKMLEAVTNAAGFRYVQCNICCCLFTSIDALRAHQIVHALMPAS